VINSDSGRGGGGTRKQIPRRVLLNGDYERRTKKVVKNERLRGGKRGQKGTSGTQEKRGKTRADAVESKGGGNHGHSENGHPKTRK